MRASGPAAGSGLPWPRRAHNPSQRKRLARLEAPMTEACDLSAVEARRLIGLKRLSPSELLESCLGAHRGDQRRGQRLRRHGCRCGTKAGQGDRAGDCQGRGHRPARPACRSASRTCRRPRACAPPWARCSTRTTCRPRTSSASPTSARPAASSWARPTRRNSAPAPTRGTASTAPPAIRSIRPRPAAARRAARRWRWRSARCRWRPARTWPEACARRPDSAAWSASAPRPASCRAWIAPLRSPRSASWARWAARWRMRICCCAPRWCRTSATRSPRATARASRRG